MTQRTPRPRRARWQEEVITKANLLEPEGQLLCRRYQANGQNPQDERAIKDSIMTAVGTHLQEARKAASVRNNLWPNGPACEGAFINLHAAQVLLVNLYSEDDVQASIPAVLDRLQKCLPETDQRRIDAEKRFGSTPDNSSNGAARQPSWNGRNGARRGILAVRNHRANHADSAGTLAQQRAALRDAMQVGYESQDKLYTQVRSFRNILIVGTVVLTLLVAGLCAVGALWPSTIPLCFQPSNTAGTSTSATTGASAATWVCPSTTGSHVPQGGDVMTVALMGLIGGAISASLTIQKLRGTSTPFGVPVALSTLKLPAGALIAIAGLVLVHGQFIPGLSDLDSQGQIAAYAIAFGIAQHLVTRYVDQKAEDVLGSVPSRERSTTDEQPPAAATPSSAQTTRASAITPERADQVQRGPAIRPLR
jgi:hypothetical protein